ncbi:hypothetical protein A2943_02715 [Candidatus Adlerbacteria bacterium RIFCSPLOWO2_01_FULL_51_16]|uniref:Uncharacterized protein n=1 Tax=Candidatus Adlerbacteria bacterium RIFCSPLOWO2_01_FULL_51_16 TaxID=1797243 RepID=A0A1F4XGH7_9BACT|nr:MAG: hypothetical protein A2943_02715 [Candidatus Adlerbacteria bacterium RIFCSPLOWO2_01_FULL_51_16]
MYRKLLSFFDRLEDKIRIRLSHSPVLYSLIGAVGIVLIWKGVWETAELFPWLFGPASVLLGVIILLVTGLLVSFFIGDSIIISGFKQEKKLVEKTGDEVKSEMEVLIKMEKKIEHLEKDVHEIQGEKRRII